MSGRDADHGGTPRRGRAASLLAWLPVVLVLAILCSALAAYRFDLGPRWFGLGRPDPRTDPAAVPPPEGLHLPALTLPPVVAAPTSGSDRLSPARVQAALAPLLADPDLGRRVFASVSPLDGGPPVYERGTGPAVPASTTKLLTTTAALETLGPDHTFETTVVPGGRGRIVLVGGGDPFLASRPPTDPTYPARADVATLARATADALRAQGRTRVQVGYDDSLFTGPSVDPHWPRSYIPDGVVAPVSALWVDEGRPASGLGRVADPAAAAAAAFTDALRQAGVTVVGAPRPGRAGTGAEPLARVSSAPLSQVVEHVLEVSDNEAAEVLARQVGVATGAGGSFVGGAIGVLATLNDLGVPLTGDRVYDGSGLSRQNRIDPATLTAVLRTAAAEDHPELRAVVTGLPVAGFTGSLADRFEDAPAPSRGRVRAKTGTLTNVSGLAGIATGLDGRPMVFVLVADRVALADTLDARDALDDAAAALGACRCGA